MNKHCVLIHLPKGKDPTLFSASLKAYLLDKDHRLEFLIDVDEKNRGIFDGYEGVRLYQEGDTFDAEVIKDETIKESRLTYLIHKSDQTRAYLLILKEYDERYLEKAVRMVSHIFKREKIKACLLSEEIPDLREDLISKRISQSEIFSIHEPLLVISERDFSLLKDHYQAFTKLYFEEKEKKKSVFSDIGNFFFKNYTSSNRVPLLTDSLAFQELLLERNHLTLNLLRDGDSQDYRSLLNTIEEYLEEK